MILGITQNARRPTLTGGTATAVRASVLPQRPSGSNQPVLRRSNAPLQLCLDLRPRHASTTTRVRPR